MESFKALAALYDHDESLPVLERIALYSELLKVTWVKDDVVHSIRQLARTLALAKDETSLRRLRNATCGWLPPEGLYDDAHNVHKFAAASQAVAARLVHRWPAAYDRGSMPRHPFVDEVERMNLTDVFASVMRFIRESPHEKELLQRLYEEMDEGQGTCTTGHLCRLVNVLRGYVDDDDATFEVTLGQKDRDRAVVFHVFNTTVDMLDPDRILTNLRRAYDRARHREFKAIADEDLVGYLCEYTRESRETIEELLSL